MIAAVTTTIVPELAIDENLDERGSDSRRIQTQVATDHKGIGRETNLGTRRFSSPPRKQSTWKDLRDQIAIGIVLRDDRWYDAFTIIVKHHGR